MTDVTARLAQGLPAVDNAGEYAAACRSLGFAGPSDAALADWYGTEEGMDLAALQSDSETLAAVATAAREAADRQAALRARLGGAWAGAGGAAAQEVLAGQDAGATQTCAALAEAAAATARLREELWAAVDAKVAAALAVDDRPAGARAAWLEAARTVTTGAGDVPAASELVDQQVRPFVDRDVATDLVAEMRSSFDRVTAAFDAAVARIEAQPAVGGASGAPELGAGAGSGVPPLPDLGAAVPSLGGMSGPGSMSGLSGLSGLSGMVPQLADLIGSIAGADGTQPPDLGLPEDPTSVDPEPEDPDPEREPEDPEDPKTEDPKDPKAEDEPTDDPEPEPGAEPGITEPEPVLPPAPLPSEPLAQPLPPTETPAETPAEATACEIAADELPSIG